MERNFSKIDECIYPYKFGCRDCEHSLAPELFDGGCSLAIGHIDIADVIEKVVDYEYVENIIKTFRKEFFGKGVTDETYRKVMSVMKLTRHTLKVKEGRT